MSNRQVYRWFVLGGAIWWMPMRLRPRVRLCDCVAPFVLAAYARAKPCCLWLVVLACVPTLVLYIWCVLAVLRSGLTTIEIKWLLLLLYSLLIRPLDVPCHLPPSVAGLAFPVIIALYIQLDTWHDIGLMLTTTTRWQKQMTCRRAANREYIRLHRHYLILHGTNTVVWWRHFRAMSPSSKRTPCNG